MATSRLELDALSRRNAKDVSHAVTSRVVCLCLVRVTMILGALGEECAYIYPTTIPFTLPEPRRDTLLEFDTHDIAYSQRHHHEP